MRMRYKLIAVLGIWLFWCLMALNGCLGATQSKEDVKYEVEFVDGDDWLVTAYCGCSLCCGKYADGVTASGKVAQYGYVACNWLPFGTTLYIEGLGEFKVQDRGAKSLFGDRNNKIKHLDVYFPTHQQAKEFGVKHLKVCYEEIR